MAPALEMCYLEFKQRVRLLGLLFFCLATRVKIGKGGNVTYVTETTREVAGMEYLLPMVGSGVVVNVC